MKYLVAFIVAVCALWKASAAGPPGKDLFERRCTGCHAIDREKSGPRLAGVYGRRAGAIAGFTYSESLRKSGVVWDRATLDRWLANPESVVPDNDMPFRLADEGERQAIIEYLRQISSK
uniref:Cytochrome c, class I n=1 Tax=Solibacter usitatus (strain Ellin6076) TaxID=234267 RepID=Q02A35_SOLUE